MSQVDAQDAQQRSAPGAAKQALVSFCRVLRLQGVGTVDPEIIRQAKFNGPVATQLWQVLHGLVVLEVVGCQGARAGSALLSMWTSVQQEAMTDAMPAAGMAMVIHYLEAWGCPSTLMRSLEEQAAVQQALEQSDLQGLDPGSAPALHQSGGMHSRPLLLVLGWLSAHIRLYERAILSMQLAADIQPLLPPYPVDTCTDPSVQSSYAAALWRAQEHTSAVATCILSSLSSEDEGSMGWSSVEVAAQHSLMLLGKARAKLQALQSLMDCRARLHNKLQDSQHQAHPGRLLTPFELHLLSNSAAMSMHMQALSAATDVLTEQFQLAASAQLFYQWLGSVLEEQIKSEQPAYLGAASGAVSGGPAAAPPSFSAASAAVGGSGMLLSLQTLPGCRSAAGAKLLQHLDTQVKEAAKPFGKRFESARTAERFSMYSQSLRKHGQAPMSASHVTLDHFLVLSSKAMQQAAGAQASAGGSCAAAGEHQGPWVLPDDVVAGVQAACSSRQNTTDQAQHVAREAGLLRGATLLRHVLGEEEAKGGALPVEAETERLLGMALAAAKSLARVRAGHKQKLMQAAEVLPPNLRVVGL